MAGRKGAYSILKGMNMSVPGATNTANSEDIPQYQQSDTPVKVTSSIKLQPVNTSNGGIQLQTMQSQGGSSNPTSKKITKISVQHQNAGNQPSPVYQPFQQSTSDQGTPVQIQRQAKPRTRAQQQQQQQQQSEQKTTIRLQQNNPQDTSYRPQSYSDYQNPQYNQQPVVSPFSSYQPQEVNQASNQLYSVGQTPSYSPQMNDQYSYQQPETSQAQWSPAQFEAETSRQLPPGSQNDPDDFEFPAVSKLSQRFQEDKPKRTAEPGSTWQTPSSPRPGRRQFGGQPQQQQPKAPLPFGADYTKPSSGSPQIDRKPQSTGYQPQSTALDSTPQPPWQQQQTWQPQPSQPTTGSDNVWQPSSNLPPTPTQKPKRQPQVPTGVPSFGTQYGASKPKKTVSQPKLSGVPSFGTQYGDPPTGSVVLPKRPLSGSQFEEQDGGFGSARKPEVQQTTSPFPAKSAQESTIPSFGAQYSPKPKATETKPQSTFTAWQPQPEPASQAPARGQRPPLQKQSSAPSSTFGTQFVAASNEDKLREEWERKKSILDQQEADTCPWSVDDIKNRVAKLRTDLFNARDENQEVREEMRKLNKILSELKTQYEYSERQRQALEYKTSELTDQIHDMQAQQGTLKMDLEQANTENDRLQRDLVRARETTESLKDTTSANTRMRMELGHVQGEHSRVQKELQRITADKAELEGSLAEANSSYNRMKMELDLMNDNIISLQRSLAAAESERGMLWDRLVKAQRDRQQMMEELMLSTDESF